MIFTQDELAEMLARPEPSGAALGASHHDGESAKGGERF